MGFQVLLSLFLFLAPAGAVRPSAEIAPSVIYGDDDRVEYFQLGSDDLKAQADATVALIRVSNLEIDGDFVNLKTTPYGQSLGLCTSEPYFEQDTIAYCSGSLIAPDIVLTAGHCLRQQTTCDATRFIFGFRLTTPGPASKQVPASQVYSCKALLHTVADPKGEDFALVRLDRPVTFAKPLPYRTEGTLKLADPLRVMGHPSGLPLKIAGHAEVRAINSNFLTANLDTYGGNSGSGVFNESNGQLEGVLVRGEMDYVLKNGCRVSNTCPNEGCRGEDVTLFERVLPVLLQQNPTTP